MAGVMAIEHADFDGVERLSAGVYIPSFLDTHFFISCFSVTGGEIVSTFDHPEMGKKRNLY